MGRRSLAAVVVIAAVTAAAGEDPRLPDISTGQINGKVAMLVWPIEGVQRKGDGAKPQRLLSPDGCETHLVPTGDPERELLFPCGQWFQPPNGTYRVWLEKPGLSTVGHGVVSYEAEPFNGRGMAMMMPLEPAGRVALAKEVPLEEGVSFRLLQIRGPKDGILLLPFERRLNATAARAGVQMGVGTVLAAIFDRRTNDAIALAPPLRIAAAQTSYAVPAPPVKGSDVFVTLERPRTVTGDEDEVALALQLGAVTRKPDLFMNTPRRVFAVWYGVEGQTAKLRVVSKSLRYTGPTLVLRPKQVVTLRGKLEILPSLGISVLAPDGALRAAEPQIEVRRPRDNELVRKAPITLGEPLRLEAVPAESLDVVLVVHPWEFRKAVDLSSGEDDSIVFELQPIVVTGTVYHGREIAPHAEVAFAVDRDMIRTTANSEGRYELVFWSPALDYRAEVVVKDRDGPPFVEGFLDVRRSCTIDFHVPSTRYTVSVVDAETKEPISGARVISGNDWSAREGSSAVQTAITDANGRASLPPLREGNLVVRARADGYFDSEPSRKSVEAIDAEGHFEIGLRPVGATGEVRLLTADGRGVAGAELWAVGTGDGHHPPLWRGTSDDGGRVVIPKTVRHSLFLIRSPFTASAIRRLDELRDEQEAWVLPPAATPIRVQASSQARLALWIDGVRVSGAALAFLTGSLEATDATGAWSTAKLQGRPLRLLAWRSAVSIESGAYDVVATHVDYPWPAVIDLTPLD